MAIVHREMPRAALKLANTNNNVVLNLNCAQGNAACGIETKTRRLDALHRYIVHREMPRAALKPRTGNLLRGRQMIVHREMPRAALKRQKAQVSLSISPPLCTGKCRVRH